MHLRKLAIAALALMLVAASAATGMAQVVPLSASAAAPVAPGSLLWRTLMWRERDPATLRETPLAALAPDRAVAIESEWAPLYHGGDGTRIEHARQLARTHTAAGPFRLGLEVSREAASFRGGRSDWGIDSGGEPRHGGSFGAAMFRLAGAVALAASLSPEGEAGFALEGTARLAGRWQGTLSLSDVPQSGALDARYDAETVVSRGDWSERRAGVSLAGPAAGGTVALTLESLDHVPRASREPSDDLVSRLGWRSARLAFATRVGPVRAGAELDHGEGRQRVQLNRDGSGYAVAAGPMREQAAIVTIGPAHARWSARAFAGSSRAAASGTLQLWPFDAMAAVAGTRYVARSSLDLGHWGVAIDGAPAARRGWDGGLAWWRVDPKGGVESWRGTLFGLGRDDYSAAAFDTGAKPLAGIRVARTQPVAGVALRMEIVQWVPLAWRSRASDASTTAPAPAPATDPAPPSHHGSTWGGTILRVSI